MNKSRMSKKEKEINYDNLQAYKNQHNEMYSMIPGWSP
jgi:hypothetical protein